MLKNWLIGIAVFALFLGMALSFITARYIDRGEIARVQLERAQMKASRDSISAVVALRDTIQSLLQKQVVVLTDQAKSLRQQISTLEQSRQVEQLTVRSLEKPEDLQDKLKKTFPEVARSDWGVKEIYNEKNDVSIDYLMVPLRFGETFIIDHQNSLSYKKQIDKFQKIDSLQQDIALLKDSVFTLEKQNRNAYQKGYDFAYAKYDTVSKKYDALLKKPPQIKFGLPQWGAVVGGTAAGIFIGRATKK